MDLTRAEVQTKIQEITQSVKDHNSVKELMVKWLADKNCTPFFTQQVLNDLTSYKEYLELLN